LISATEKAFLSTNSLCRWLIANLCINYKAHTPLALISRTTCCTSYIASPEHIKSLQQIHNRLYNTRPYQMEGLQQICAAFQHDKMLYSWLLYNLLSNINNKSKQWSLGLTGKGKSSNPRYGQTM